MERQGSLPNTLGIRRSELGIRGGIRRLLGEAPPKLRVQHQIADLIAPARDTIFSWSKNALSKMSGVSLSSQHVRTVPCGRRFLENGPGSWFWGIRRARNALFVSTAAKDIRSEIPTWSKPPFPKTCQENGITILAPIYSAHMVH